MTVIGRCSVSLCRRRAAPGGDPRELWGRSRGITGLIIATTLLLAVARCTAVEHVRHVVDGKVVQHDGEVVLEDPAGGVMLRSADDQLHLIPAPRVRQRSHDDDEFELYDADELGEKLLAELPADFRLHQSKHYVVCYNTTDAYARWCSSLLERLQRAFIAYMAKRGCKVAAPKWPLAVLIFADQASYAEHAKAELGPSVANVIGYYSMATNRIVMYDLTGAQAEARQFSNRGSSRDISVLLSQPAAEPLVATIVHEATHQIAFNCGVQKRFNDNPLWMSEGLAMYFETPDLSSSRSWSGVGEVNYQRWDQFQANQDAGRLLPFEQLVGSDDAFRNPATATDAYAQAWALSYFLIRWRPEQYVAYVEQMASKPPLTKVTPKQRVADFKKHFGDLEELRGEFQRQMSRIR
ncbi:MAG: DUF1570 domain-containing protein [Planctomycetales bacterium]|nr:DUF1570 domain-containing protein [Planctomycetales bacterium]